VTRKILSYSTAVLISAVHVIPFFLLANLALKTQQDTSSKWVTPRYLYLQNFVEVWIGPHLDRAILNTLIITICSVALVVFIGVLASYPLARVTTRWNNFIYTLSVATLIVPALTVLVPLYKLVVDIHGSTLTGRSC
jgi:raffinose/stachyose/melibiose transport system permease protein